MESFQNNPINDPVGAIPGRLSSSARQFSAHLDLGRWLFLALVTLFIIALGYSTVFRAAWNEIERTDYTVYRVAGQAVLDGQNIYAVQNSRGWNYVYPPAFAILLAPFAKLSIAWGSALWFLLSVLALASAAVMTCRLVSQLVPPRQPDDIWSFYELPIFLVSPWLMSGLLRCQASEFMIWLMIAAIYFWKQGRQVIAGASLAAAALIKVFPLAFLVYFAWHRQWRFLGAFFLVIILGGLVLPSTVYGWQKNLDYIQQWGKLVAGPALGSNSARADNPLYHQLLNAKKNRNQSLEALFLSLEVPPVAAKPLLAVSALLMFGVMTWSAKKAGPSAQVITVSAFLVWNLLIPPISETHYFGLLLVPVTVLTALAFRSADGMSRRLAAASLLLLFGATLWSVLDKRMEAYRLLCWASLGVWLSLVVLNLRHGPLGCQINHPKQAGSR